MNNTKYNKIIISKFSPENHCNVHDGEVLIILPKKDKIIKDLSDLYFVSANDFKTKSKFGWVKQVDEFSKEEFINSYYSIINLNENVLNHIDVLLNSINKLPEGTPVAAHFYERGILQKEILLKVQKVFFYQI